MTIQVDVVVKGIETVERSGKLFRAMAEAIVKTAGGFEKLTPAEKEAVAALKQFGAEAGTAQAQMKGLAAAMIATEKAMKGMAAVKSPFTKMNADFSILHKNTMAVNAELRKTAQISKEKMETPGYMKSLQNTQAGLVLEEQLNAAIIKQGKLRADLAMQQDKGNNKTLQAQVDNLKKAEAETKKLVAETEKLAEVERKKARAIKENIAALDKQRQSMKALSAQKHKELGLTEKILAAQKKLAIEASKGALGKQRTQAIKENIAALDKQRKSVQSLAAQRSKELGITEAAIEAQRKLAMEATKGVLGKQRTQAIKENIAALDKQRQSVKSLSAQKMKELGVTEKALAVQKRLAIEATKGDLTAQRTQAIKENIAALDKQRKSMQSLTDQRRIELGLTEKTLALQRSKAMADNQAALNAQRMTEILKTQLALDRQRQAGLAKQAIQIAQPAKVYQAQANALTKLQTRLNTLGQSGAKVTKLKETLHDLNLTLARTGKMPTRGFAQLTAELRTLEGGFKQSGKTTLDWSKNMKYAMGGVARSMGAMTYSYGMLAPLMAGMAFGAAIKEVYKLGASFEYTTTYIDALGESLNDLDASAIQEQLLGIEGLRKGPQELALGMKEFAKAGEDAASSMGQIEEMAKFATIAEIELGDAVKLVVGQSKAFGVEYADSANMIAAAALSSATDIEELGTALSYTTELATVSGTTFDEVATAMALMANAGIRGSKAGTAIRTSIIKMQAPSEKLKTTLDELGISWSAFSEEGQIKDMRTMFTELKRVTDNLPPAQKVAVLKELFGLRALKGGANILRSMGDEWDSLNEKIRASTEGLSFIEEKYAEMADTATAKVEVLGVETQKALIKAFDSKDVKKALDSLAAVVSSPEFVSSLASIVSSLSSLASQVAGLAAVASQIGAVSDSLRAFNSAMPWEAFEVFDEWLQKQQGKDNEGIIGWFIKKDLEYIEKAKKEYAAYIIQVEGVFELERQARLGGPKEGPDPKEQLGIMFPLTAKMIQEHTDKQAEVIKKAQDKLQKVSEGAYLQPQPETGTVFGPQPLGGGKPFKSAEDFINQLRDIKEKLKIENEKQLKYQDPFMGALDSLKQIQPELDKLNYANALIGATEWEKKIESIDQKIAKMVEKREDDELLPYSSREIEALRDALITNLRDKGLHEIAKASEELTFKTMITGLQMSASEADKVKAAFMVMEDQAKKFLAAKGVAFDSDEGKKYFKALVQSTGLFEKAIKSAKKKVEAMQQTIADTKFSFKTDIWEEREKLRAGPTRDPRKAALKFQIEQVRELQKAAKKASLAGEDGWKRQLELLKKAYSITKSMDTTADVSSAKAEMERAKAVMKKYADATNYVRARSKKEYLEAKKVYEAAERGDVDKTAQKKKIKMMSSLQKAILRVQETEKKRLEEEHKGVEKMQEKAIKAWTDTETATASAKEELSKYGAILDETGTQLAVWGNKNVKSIDAMRDALIRFKKEAQGMSTNQWGTVTKMGSGKAGGGPVQAGTTYPVGERGVELFTPSQSGYIIPNNKLTQSRSDSVDINLSINNKVIPLQGSRQSADSLVRELEEMQRTAS